MPPTTCLQERRGDKCTGTLFGKEGNEEMLVSCVSATRCPTQCKIYVEFVDTVDTADSCQHLGPTHGTSRHTSIYRVAQLSF